ncbi:MAG: 30S ribosomal protein S2 [candidate division WOR-3 bacterium]|nr:30S ribosomal protein S2 [candidate division WOR-3 bacterium]MCX7947268.1 30S ribosomal protein S2 [candidate division WOR-3 bacterium]MDW8150175.1 30S ribosomal protein S2 [candidate division WOR-3 bacterium]
MQEVKEEGLGNIPNVKIEQLLEAGAHFGHKKSKWNPKMAKYIFREINGYHILDLRKTILLLENALRFIYDIASKNGNILFVCTKKNLRDTIVNFANEAGVFYVVERWPGGLLTNFETTKQRLIRIKELEGIFEEYNKGKSVYVKKEIVELQKEYDKLLKKFGGVRSMEDLPSAIYIIDPVNEKLAVHEANVLKIPTIAICDTNADPELITYPIPANDDAIKSVSLITSLVVETIKRGKQAGLTWQI